MQRFLTSLALTFALALHASPSAALGFGKVSGTATLGQALHFVVAVRLEASESLEPACVKAEVTAGDRQLPAELVRIRIESADAGSTERRLHVLSTIPIDEPVMAVALQVGCPASLSRSFVVFADPPLRNLAAEVPLPPERGESPLAAVLNAVPAGAASSGTTAERARRPASQAPRSRAGSPASMPAAAAAGTLAQAQTQSTPAAPRARKAAPLPKPSSGPVLRLDPVEAEALVLPRLQMTPVLGQVPDPATAGSAPRYIDPETAQRMREQERLKALDDALVKLRTDNQATQKALADMQARVNEAEAGRFANPLVYALLALCALLAALAGAFWWLRRRDRQHASWWSAQEATGTTEVPAPVPEAFAGEAEAPAPVIDAPAPLPTQQVPRSPPMDSAPMPLMVSAPMPLRSAAEPTGPRVEPRRPMSAEELIDLEQQAEFFVVLGQDDAAIDLLMGHVRSTGGVSPLPYLKLLEIYRRRGEREAYDRIRERFNRRFNAYAPEWEVDPEQGLSLEGYPEVLKRLQNGWATPSQAMELLDASLFRRDAGPTFDVPAYRELLFLYSMARDLAERDIPANEVDLLLPIGDEAPPAMTTIEAMPAPAPSPVDPHFSLDFDLSSDPPPNLSLEDRDFKRKTR